MQGFVEDLAFTPGALGALEGCGQRRGALLWLRPGGQYVEGGD